MVRRLPLQDLHLDFRRAILAEFAVGQLGRGDGVDLFRHEPYQHASSLVCGLEMMRACMLPPPCSPLVKMRLSQSHHVGFTCKQHRGNRSKACAGPAMWVTGLIGSVTGCSAADMPCCDCGRTNKRREKSGGESFRRRTSSLSSRRESTDGSTCN
jgi:hypothetical protein